MKKQILSLAITMAALSLAAQIQQGKILLGASLPISSGIEGVPTSWANTGSGISYTKLNSNGDSGTNLSLGLSPRIGYALTKRLLVSTGVGLFTSTLKSEDTKFRTSSFSIEPQARYYFLDARAAPFAEAGFAFTRLHSKIESGFFDSEQSVNINSLWGGAGVSLFLSTSTALDLMLAYQSNSMKDPEDPKDKLSLGTVRFHIGFSWFLR